MHLKKYMVESDKISETSDIELCLEMQEISNSFEEVSLLKKERVNLLNLASAVDQIVKRANNHVLTENDYFYFKNQLEDITKIIGIDYEVPSLENFSKEELSLEGIKEIAGKIKEKTKNIISKIKEKIFNILSKIKGSSKKVSVKIEELRVKLEELEKRGASVNEDKLSMNLTGLISPGQDAKDIKFNLNNLVSELKNYESDDKLINAVNSNYKKIIESVKKFTSEKKVIPFFKNIAEYSSDFFKTVNSIPTTKGDGKISSDALHIRNPDSWKINKYGCLLDNEALYSHYPKNGFKINEADASKFHSELEGYILFSGVYTIAYVDGKVSNSTSYNVFPLSDIKELITLLSECSNLLTEIGSQKFPETMYSSELMTLSEELDTIDPVDSKYTGEDLGLGYLLNLIVNSFCDKVYIPKIDLVANAETNILKIINFCEQNLKKYS